MVQFITSEEDYLLLRDRSSKIFTNTPQGLPSNIFLEGFASYRFVEFDIMLFAEFWHVVAGCAERCGDSEVDILVFDPDPVAYYYENFGYYAAVRFGLHTSAVLQYKEVFLAEPSTSPADALQYRIKTCAWFGSSSLWGFWADRDLGIGVAATRDSRMSWPNLPNIHWFDLNDALSTLIAPNFEDGVIPKTISEELRWTLS